MKVILYGFVKVSKLIFSEWDGTIKEKSLEWKKIEKIPYENVNIVLEEDNELQSVLINGDRYKILEKILDTNTCSKGYLVDYIIRTDLIELDEQTKNSLLETENIVNGLIKQFPSVYKPLLSKIAIALSEYNGETIVYDYSIYYGNVLKTENIKKGIIDLLKKVDVKNAETLDKIKDLHDMLNTMNIPEKTIDVYLNIISQLFLIKVSLYGEWKTSLDSKRSANKILKCINTVFSNYLITHDWNIFNMSDFVCFQKRRI